MVAFSVTFASVGTQTTKSKRKHMKGTFSSFLISKRFFKIRGSKHTLAKAKALANIRKLSEWNAKEQDKIEGYLAEADRAAKVSDFFFHETFYKFFRKHINEICEMPE